MSLFADYAATVLEARPRAGGTWADFRCRIHDDRSASCSINVEDGRVHCQAACCNWQGWVDEYATECGLLPPPDKPGWRDGKPVKEGDFKTSTPLAHFKPAASYVYRDKNGKPYMKVDRVAKPDGGKSFPSSRWTGAAWDLGLAQDFPRILYRLDELLKSTDQVVLVTEGEKDADRAWNMGFAATTAPNGAKKADLVEDWTAFQGKDAVIIADNDKVGMQHAKQVASLVLGIARSIRIITMPDVPEKGDLSDWVDAGGTADDLRDLIAETPAFGGMIEEAEKPPTLDRVFIERAFVCNAWDHLPTAQVLASFRSKNFKDPAARAASQAIKRILKRSSELEPLAVGSEMARTGEFELWTQLEKFANERLRDLGLARASTYKSFRERCNWDDGAALVKEAEQAIGQGLFQEWVSAQHAAFTTLLTRAETVEYKTLKRHVEDWLKDILEGKPDRETFRLRMLADVIGRSGGGDVVVCVAPPKTGKSTVAMKLVTDLAGEGIKSLVCQLEMRMDQVVKREVAKILGRNYQDNVPPEQAEKLLQSGQLSHLEHIHFTSRATTLDACRAEVAAMLAKNPDIKFWVIDYAECLQKFGNGANRVDESEAIAKFVKETAIAFNVCAFLLVQPTKEYSKEGATGPKAYHAKNCAKWEQDAQAMIFLQSPARFFADMPKEYIEVHVLCARDSDTGVIPLKWKPEIFDYERWSGPVPAGGGRTLQQQVEMERYTLPRPEFEDCEDVDDALARALAIREDRYR